MTKHFHNPNHKDYVKALKQMGQQFGDLLVAWFLAQTTTEKLKILDEIFEDE